jgi:hypothetical protein
MQLGKNCKITRVMNAVAAGTTDQNSSVVDMQNWEGVLFIAFFGTLTATQVTLLKAQQGEQADGSDMADLAGTATPALADADSNKCLALDIKNPRERYVRAVIDRGTANAVIDGMVAIQYGPRKAPTSHDSSVKTFEGHVSPAEGTA